MKKIPLDYQKNVRDICGLVGFNGKKVKEGHIYRGGVLSHVSDNDIKTINSLRLTDIVDFRSAIEFNARPDYPFMGVTFHNFPALDEASQEGLKKKNDSDDSNLLWFLGDSTDGFGHMYNLYPVLLISKVGIEAYKNFFKVLLKDKNRVVYFHCSQGKDRAGLAAYLIEIALGVSHEDALKDYLQTNEAMELKLVQLKEKMKGSPLFTKNYEQAMDDVFAVRKEYLLHAVEEVNKKYGSVLEYIKNILEVDVDKLREYYLQ